MPSSINNFCRVSITFVTYSPIKNIFGLKKCSKMDGSRGRKFLSANLGVNIFILKTKKI